MQKPITIIGGGLAGLTLGIGLRQRDVPVEIWEAGRYPRHRVCGEFVSGNGQESLERLGLWPKLVKANSYFAKSAAFFSSRSQTGVYILPKPALCLSRFTIDCLLANEFRNLGGELKENARWTGQNFADGIVRASGRRIEMSVEGWRFFGLKVHARNVELESDLEMHFGKNGYVGLCKLADGEVNVCGLLRSRTAMPQLAESWKEVLKGETESPLRRRLEKADFDEESFCTVAGISLKPKRALHFCECVIGDALTMIPPVTGNGMSMAFESAEVAIEPLREYSLGRWRWAKTQETIAQECDALFRRRLFWASKLQNVLMQPGFCSLALRGVSHFSPIWKFLFSKTR